MEKSPRRVHLDDQPVRPAIALVVVSVLLGVVWALTALIPRLFTNDLREPAFTDEFPTRVMVISMIIAAGVLLLLGLGVASFVLAVVVAVKGGGKLRLGAGLMIAASLFGLVITFFGIVISFTVSGDTSQVPDAAVAVSNVFSVLEVVVDVIRAVAMVVGIVILILGIREVRRERAELPAR